MATKVNYSKWNGTKVVNKFSQDIWWGNHALCEKHWYFSTVDVLLAKNAVLAFFIDSLE